MCETGRTVCAAVTSIFQNKACCFKEYNRGRPPPPAFRSRPSCQQRCGLGGCGCTCCSCMLATTHGPQALSDNNPGKWGLGWDIHTHTKCYTANTHTATLHQQNCQALVLCLYLWLKLHSAMGIKEELQQKRISSPPVEFPLIYSSCHLPSFIQVQHYQRGTDIHFPNISFSSSWEIWRCSQTKQELIVPPDLGPNPPISDLLPVSKCIVPRTTNSYFHCGLICRWFSWLINKLINWSINWSKCKKTVEKCNNFLIPKMLLSDSSFCPTNTSRHLYFIIT